MMKLSRLQASWQVAVTGALCALLAACGSSSSTTPSSADTSTSSSSAKASPGAGKPPVTFGTKNYTEQLVLGQLYTQALRAKGYPVHLKPGIGPTEVINKQLASGRIDIYPEYTGVINTVVDAVHSLTGPAAPAKAYEPPATAHQAYNQAYAFEKSRGFRLLRPAKYENGIRIAVTPRFAKKHHHLNSMTGLKKISSFKLGGPSFIKKRFEGLQGMRRVYNLKNVKFTSYAPGKQYAALASGKVDAIAVLLTDGRLAKQHLKLLSDPKKVFGFQNAAPLINKDKLAKEGPEFAATLNAVSAKLTDKSMRHLNAEVALEHRKPASVAHRFLTSHGLV
jgi:osmoprotectant transport system substrate-binding protein